MMLTIFWRRLVSFGFRLLYNELAFTYDLVSKVVSLGSWRCWQRTALPYLEGIGQHPVLELAHGTGDLQLDLHAAGITMFGYDLSPYMGRTARNKILKQDTPVRLTRGLAQQLPFPSSTFAAVVSTFPTDFIIAPETLREIHRILISEGRLIVVPNGILTGGGVVKSFLEWLYRITGQREGSALDTSMLDFLKGYGFHADVFTVSCPHSVAQVVVATKEVAMSARERAKLSTSPDLS